MTPSLERRNTPPIIFLFSSSKLYSDMDNLVSIGLPVSLSMMLVNSFSQLEKTLSAVFMFSSLTSTVMFLSIILSMP